MEGLRSEPRGCWKSEKEDCGAQAIMGDGMGEGTQLIAIQQPGVLSSDVATQGVRAAGLIVPPPESTGPPPSRVPEASEKNRGHQRSETPALKTSLPQACLSLVKIPRT